MRKRSEKGWIVSFLCSIILLGIFAVGALLLLNVGVRVYKNVALSNAENYKLRTSLSYVATKLRQSDASDSISLEERKNIPVLCLREMDGDEETETLIYYYKGSLREVYQFAGATFRPESGNAVVELTGFTISAADRGKIIIEATNKTETQSLQVHLHSDLSE